MSIAVNTFFLLSTCPRWPPTKTVGDIKESKCVRYQTQAMLQLLQVLALLYAVILPHSHASIPIPTHVNPIGIPLPPIYGCAKNNQNL